MREMNELLTSGGHVLNLGSRYQLVPGVKFRQEDFGGVVYRRQDDRLLFLNTRMAIDLLQFAGRGTVREIITLITGSCAPTEAMVKHILKILVAFEELGIIYELAG